MRKTLNFLLPDPLMQPTEWPHHRSEMDSSVNVILPLDVAVVAGGPLKKRILELAGAPHSWFVADRLSEKRSSVEHSLLIEGATTLLKSFPGTEIINGITALNSFGLSLPSLRAWAAQVFPSLLISLGELRFRSLLKGYEKEFPEAAEFPWEGLRFFAGYLRRAATPDDAAIAAHDWARFRALFSPQDEVAERASLKTDDVVLNPTVQILKPTPPLEKIILVYRKQSDLDETTIGWREAFLLDEIGETPRVNVETLLENAGLESARSEMDAIFADLKTPSEPASFKEAFERLLHLGVLLKGL